jgi:hypothetical protein
MRLNTTLIALVATTLGGALPAFAQTSMTIEAEGMTLSSYAVENGNRIKLTSSSGSASKSFGGASGTYKMQVYVQPETDGQSTLQVYRGTETTALRTYTYPLSNTATSFTIDNVALNSGQTIKLVGRVNAGAVARVDKIVLTPVASSTPTSTTPTTSASAVTMQAEGMTLSSYAIENGNRITLTSSSGSASRAFSGASGTYNVQVYVQLENDGQPTLELYRGSTLLRRYVYPLGTSLTNFTVSNVALSAGQQVRLVGRRQGGASARVDRLVFQPVATTAPVGSTPTTSTSTTPTTSTSTTPTTSTSTTPTESTSAAAPTCANPANGHDGFGRNTTGGAGQPVYRVTNLNDSGAGSLRDALSQGNRCVVFDVGGTISLAGHLIVRGANITIDGLTAPAPGITLRDRTLVMQGSSGAGNIVVRGIRHRYAPAGEDAMRVYNASNIVFDRVSVSGFGDGAIDVTENSRDVLIQWSILGNGNPLHNTINLIGYNTSRVTVHHNLYINGGDRNPKCDGTASEIVCDLRNNLIWNYKWYGTRIGPSAHTNVINNYYYSPDSSASSSKTIYMQDGASAYVAGNYSQNGWNINASGNGSTPYAAAVAPATTDAITAARQVVAQAGARGPRFGLDATDLGYIGQVSIAGAPTTTGTPTTSGTTTTGGTTTASDGGVCSTAQCVLTQ